MTRFELVLPVIVALGCSGRSAPEPAQGSAATPGSATPSEKAPAAPPADAAVVAIDAGLKGHMRDHFAAVSDLQRALARGHLDQAKEDARWIVEHEEPDQLATWAMDVNAMKQAARDVLAAPDVPTAAAHVSHLGRSCSRCHEQTAAVVTFAWEEPPGETSSLASQMQRHQWAARRLWEGLVGPNDGVWKHGAQVLATTQLDTTAASGGSPRADVTELAARVRALATKATTLDEQDDRAALYGELLSTCAGCHALVRPKPVPGP